MNSPIISLSLHFRGRIVTKRRKIKNFVKTQPLFDVHQQYLKTFLKDLKVEFKFRGFAVKFFLLIFSKFSSIIIGFYLL